MNAIDLLIYLTERQIDSIFRAAAAIPADKLEWAPTPGNRSALDQLQEVATAPVAFWSAYSERKVEWDQEKFEKWKAERSKITTLPELEKLTRENIAKVVEFMRGLDPSELTAPVELPFPGSYNLADVLAYNYWNMGYHEGQITYIAAMLESNAG